MPFTFASVEDEYKKNPELKKYDVTSLQEWADKQPHLPKMSEFDIILFLQSCRYSNETAKNAIDNYFTMRTICPEFFMNRNPDDPEVKLTSETSMFTALPQKSPEGYTLFIARLIDPNPEYYVFPLQVKLFDMALSMNLYKYGTMKGVRVILDMEGGTLSHLARVGLSQLKKSIFYVQEAVPIRLVGVHFINVVPFMDKIMMMIKPFMKKELADLIHVHGKLESFFEFVPQESLPKDYGGKSDSLAQLHAINKRDFQEAKELFKSQDLMVVDESKRPPNTKSGANSVFGACGTFKKIEVD